MTMSQLLLIADLSLVRAMNDLKLREVDGDQSSADNLDTFEHDGQDIWDPFVDESGRCIVDPIDYYGEKKLRGLVQRFYAGA